jgi:hypothetical protein
MFKLHKTKGEDGCGPAALQILLGGGSRTWAKRIMAYRRNNLPVGERKFAYIGTSQWTYNNEIEAMIRRRMKDVKFRFVKAKIRAKAFIEKLDPKKTFLISLTNHFIIAQNGRIFDNSETWVKPINFRYDADRVEAYMELRNFVKYKPSKVDIKRDIREDKDRIQDAIIARQERRERREREANGCYRDTNYNCTCTACVQRRNFWGSW